MMKSHRQIAPGLFITALLALSPVFAALTGCSKANNTSVRRSKSRPDTRLSSEDRAKQAKTLAIEKQNLSAWMWANTPYSIVPSVAAVVVRNNEVIFRETVRCDPSTRFIVASLTKTFTAIAILQLVNRGILSFNDPISKYLHVNFENPELRSSPITIWHLLTHTSGLVEDPSPKQVRNNFPFVVPEQKYPTGFRFNYSNQGYNLLGYIVFEASGLTLGEYVTRNILVPMEMTDSRAPAETRGASGIECSINDLAKYLIMLMNGGKYKGRRIVPGRMYRKIIEETIEEPKSKNKEYRGLCFRVWSIDDKIVSLHHAAHMPGSGGFMQFFPAHGCGYIFISNPPVYDREEFYGYYYSMKSRMIYFCKKLIEDGFDPINFQPDQARGKMLELYVGRYRLYANPSGGQFIDIELHPGGYLIATKSYTGLRYVIIPTSLHTFVYIYPGQSEKGEIFDFVIKKGKVVGLGAKEGYFTR